jgi:hypothetical protein
VTFRGRAAALPCPAACRGRRLGQIGAIRGISTRPKGRSALLQSAQNATHPSQSWEVCPILPRSIRLYRWRGRNPGGPKRRRRCRWRQRGPLPRRHTAREEPIQIEFHLWQRREGDDASLVDRLLIRPIRVSHPARQRPLKGVDKPDVGIASLLIDRQLGVKIVISG